MEIQYLRTVMAVLRTKSFSRAAAALNVTQSAVSHRVKYLEDHYGCTLIDRSGAEITPTEAGLRLLKKAEQIVQLENELEKDLLNTESCRKFSICTTVAFGINYLPKIMDNFFASRPNEVNLNILFQPPRQLLDGLRDDSYDVAVLEHDGRHDFTGLKTFDLPCDELIFISKCKAELDNQQSPLSWLLNNNLITRLEGCSCRDVLTTNLKKGALQMSDFKNTVVCDDLRMTIDSVLAGGGVSFVSRNLVKDYIEKGLLHECRVDGFVHQRNVTVLFKPNKSTDDNVQFFMGTLLAAMDMPQPVL